MYIPGKGVFSFVQTYAWLNGKSDCHQFIIFRDVYIILLKKIYVVLRTDFLTRAKLLSVYIRHSKSTQTWKLLVVAFETASSHHNI